MRKLSVFNSISIDGYFTDKNSDMSWAHNPQPDEEFDEFVVANAGGGGVLLFGRKTYDLMASFWPTPQAQQTMPEVAVGMNRMTKYVFSKSLNKVSWENSYLIKGDLLEEVQKIKSSPGPDIAILGSGSLVSQLTNAGLIDEYQMVIIPLILGSGRTQFEGLKNKLPLKLNKSKHFKNGNVFLSYSVPN
ncbi:MAG: dihydrofolate reductase family protein [Bacillota bacterium]